MEIFDHESEQDDFGLKLLAMSLSFDFHRLAILRHTLVSIIHNNVYSNHMFVNKGEKITKDLHRS